MLKENTVKSDMSDAFTKERWKCGYSLLIVHDIKVYCSEPAIMVIWMSG